MSVDEREVRRIAGLAKLSLEDEEVDRLAEEMNRILAHAERLRAVHSSADSTQGDGNDDRREGEGDSASRAARERAAPAASDPHAQAARPDVLARPLSDFAPEMDADFFTVPPPPGVTGSES